jgi:hypothetical protein
LSGALVFAFWLGSAASPMIRFFGFHGVLSFSAPAIAWRAFGFGVCLLSIVCVSFPWLNFKFLWP